MTASGVPTGTLVLGVTSCRPITPSQKISTSIAPLSVSTTATISPRCTSSPGCFSHSTSVPASMSAPRDGMRNSAMDQGRPMHCFAAATIVGTCGNAASSKGCGYGIGTSALHARDRRVARTKRLLHDTRADLGGKAARTPGLIDDHGMSRTRNGLADRDVVERPQRAQVNHLRLHSLSRQLIGRLQYLGQRAAIGDETHILAGAPDRSLVDRHRAGGVGEQSHDVVEHD